MTVDTKKQATLEFVSTIAEIAYDGGFANGFEAGQAVGFTAGISSLKGALADGLRHGSPECGRALESLKRLGLED
ncbi:hypothetical protein OQB66_21770 [Pseudomonas syringae]|uniref:hypothetical protein n=1 Tax=Pseudomonas syringae TaxID=317 RepID=UPI0007308AFE|nr:hypothetical protein [Pseudomonas syringae]KTC06311.1 hypothetical protein AO387_01695 [Pseudomonas syringae ICMP 11168]UZS72151.1 hypothetical protein OQB66_21770 [Pseudomonas syringae]